MDNETAEGREAELPRMLVPEVDAAFHKRVIEKQKDLEGIYETGDCMFEFAYETVTNEDLQATITTLRNQLSALRDQNVALRALCGRAAAMLEDELGLEGLVDDLRQAAKEGEG